MIIGAALGRLFNDLSIRVNNNKVNVQFNYGNQDMLEKFIALSDERQQPKYPLVFYVTSENKITPSGNYHIDTQLVIMAHTNIEFLAKQRTQDVYVDYIDPVYHLLRRTIDRNRQITLLGANKEDKFSYVDLPNYGVIRGDVGGSKSNQSVVTDFVDARLINFNFRIKPECIK